MDKEYGFDLDEALDGIDLTFNGYVPSEYSLEFFALMRVVTGEDFEFPTPLWHYFAVDMMLGQINNTDHFPYSEEVRNKLRVNKKRIGFMASRGLAKSSVVTNFFPIYCAIKGVIPDMGQVYFILALGASAQGGGRVMAMAIKSMCEDSRFCNDYFEKMRFTETEAEFTRKGPGSKDKRTFLLRTMGVGTGSIRGVRSNVGAHRPDIIMFDDCIPNMAAAYSETQMAGLEMAMNADAINALKGGGKGKIFNIFTPFHLQDPNVKSLTSGAYTPIAIPVCEVINDSTTEETFVGAWEDMHPYEAVYDQYQQAKMSGTLDAFMQERMLRVSSEDQRMIQDEMIQWYDRKMVVKLLDGYRLYLTTDFTTTSEAKSDFSALSLWAVNSNGDYYLLDLCVKKQGLQEQYNELFRMVNFWKRGGRNIEVGIEIDGQQKAHIFALKEMMMKRNEYFSFARQKGAPVGREGILSKATGGNKHERFRYMLPLFQNKKFYFPEELRDTPDMKEALRQLKYTTYTGFAGHDDYCFTGDTEILMSDGTTKPIKDVEVGDMISTYGVDSAYSKVDDTIVSGEKEVYAYAMSDGYVVKATKNHPVLTTDGWKPIGNVTASDKILRIVKCSKNTTEESGLKNVVDTTKVLLTSMMESINGYINTCGKKLMENSLKAMMYITRTIIRITTTSRT